VSLQDRIDRIKDDISIASVVEAIGGVVEESFNDWQKTRCPFHFDEHPSASVNPVAGRFNCHVCQIKEDIIGVARLHLQVERGERVPFEDVLAWLEETWL
jgi:DNA primase